MDGNISQRSKSRGSSTNSYSSKTSVTTLWQCFEAVMLKKKVHIPFSAYKIMVVHDLNIHAIGNMNETNISVLAKALNYFMTQWPGWIYKAYFSDGPRSIKDWFTDYKSYLRDRVKHVMHNIDELWTEAESTGSGNASSSASDSVNGFRGFMDVDMKSAMQDAASQTDVLEFAPYNLAFSGQPSIVNSLYFVNTGKISARFHEVLKLDCLTAKQLLNCPYVSVNVTLPEISFGRRMDHNFTRYITTKPLDPRGFNKTDDKITSVRRMDSENYETTVYTHAFLKEYFSQFFALLRKYNLSLSEERVLELETIAGQYLNDIEDCDLYDTTMATNMAVTYRIGGQTYVRSKTWRQGKEGSAISFYERIVPRATFFLKSCTAVQDTSSTETSFILLNKLERAVLSNSHEDTDLTLFILQLRDSENTVSYSCTMCEKVFSYYQLLYKHYRQQHGGDQPIVCDVCKERSTFGSLTERRWAHTCKGPPKGVDDAGPNNGRACELNGVLPIKVEKVEPMDVEEVEEVVDVS